MVTLTFTVLFFIFSTLLVLKLRDFFRIREIIRLDNEIENDLKEEFPESPEDGGSALIDWIEDLRLEEDILKLKK